MSSHYARPESALRKAKDLVKIEQPEQALTVLHQILTSRRHRTWQETHEKIMFQYIDLAVELRKKQAMKDALVQYRMICQQSHMDSMEIVMKYFQQKSETKLQEAQKQADELGSTEDLADDDDEEDVPTAVFLIMSGTLEDTKSRADRQILSPWLKYQWEAYRMILEVLRNNQKLLPFYQATARRAFEFCLKYERHTSFRRLCEILRTHILTIDRHRDQTNAVDLNAPANQKLYLETRFLQLEIAAKLELWQEAYRTIEDIHESMMRAQEQPEPALMVTYYENLAQIFWASENYLFHAYTMDRLERLKVAAGNIEPEERQRLSSAVLLATLAIPPTDRYGGQEDDTVFDSQDEGNLRLANLLGFKKEVPTRSKLLQSLLARNILSEVSPEAAQLHELLETGFLPNSLNKKVAPLLTALANTAQADGQESKTDTKHQAQVVSKYVEPLRDLTVLRVLQQVSRVYKTMRIAKFQTISPDIPFQRVERLIMRAAKADQLSTRVDHMHQLLLFSEDRMEADRMKLQLTRLAQKLATVADRIQPPAADLKMEQRKHVFTLVLEGVEVERKDVFDRQRTIEQIKQENERRQVEKERLAIIREREEKDRRIKEERERLEKEKLRREQMRIKKEEEAKALKEKQQLAQDIEKKIQATLQGQKLEKASKKLEELKQNFETVDTSDLLQAQNEVLAQQKAEKEREERDRVKRHDFLQRAIILENGPKLEKAFEEKKVQDRVRYAEQYAKFVDQQKKIHATMLAEKNRLARLTADKDEYQKNVMERRRLNFADARAAQRKRIEAKRAELIHEAEVRRQHEEQRRREEEEKRRLEEERAAQLERERQAAEAAQRKKEEAARERQRKLDELAEKQRRREEEIERKEREERERRSQPRAAAAPRRAPETEDRAWRRPAARPEPAAKPERDLDWGRVRQQRAAAPRADRDPRSAARPEDKPRPAGAWRPSARRDDPRRDAPRDGLRREEAARGPPRRDAPRDSGRDMGNWRRAREERSERPAQRPIRRERAEPTRPRPAVAKPNESGRPDDGFTVVARGRKK